MFQGGKLIEPALSYQINSVLYKVHNTRGRYLNEQQYCDAIEQELRSRGINFKREFSLPPSFKGEHQGRNRVDFLIKDKIILEVKAKTFVTKDDYFQVKRYLTSLNLELAILVNFRKPYLTPKRILNPKNLQK